MLKFYVKVFRTSLFPNPFDGIASGLVKWWILVQNSMGYHPHLCIYDFKVKVTDLEFSYWSFTLKVFGPRYFQTRSCSSFMFGMMIDTGPKFYRVSSLCPVHDLKVKVMDLEFLGESFTLKMFQKGKELSCLAAGPINAWLYYTLRRDIIW